MKNLFKIKMAALVLFVGLAFSCKKNETAPADNYTNESDSTQTTVDSISPNSDTTNLNTSTTGTTGATGEGSTGSGSAGTLQKGNTSVRTDSTSTAKGK
ncbi:hypothetical protein [Flavobacterium aquidurense]|uniref:Lipoprotein n=1 Tax=Flavobacterium aquidurense TaxID=362413 RepID=A0A0Q0WEJ8_9FLAO|nr:hypothetical protein [Flavobacterium aquidurense]KQB42712.1 hypothetical protein RC62_3719 [Flavobacterium aquidurense]